MAGVKDGRSGTMTGWRARARTLKMDVHWDALSVERLDKTKVFERVDTWADLRAIHWDHVSLALTVWLKAGSMAVTEAERLGYLLALGMVVEWVGRMAFWWV